MTLQKGSGFAENAFETQIKYASRGRTSAARKAQISFIFHRGKCSHSNSPLHETLFLSFQFLNYCVIWRPSACVFILYQNYTEDFCCKNALVSWWIAGITEYIKFWIKWSLPKFEPLRAVWPEVNFVTSLSFSFFLGEIGMIRVLTWLCCWDVCMRWYR